MDNIPEDDPNDDTVLPIVPQVQQPPPTVPKVENISESDATVPMLPRVIGTAIKIEKQTDTTYHISIEEKSVQNCGIQTKT